MKGSRAFEGPAHGCLMAAGRFACPLAGLEVRNLLIAGLAVLSALVLASSAGTAQAEPALALDTATHVAVDPFALATTTDPAFAGRIASKPVTLTGFSGLLPLSLVASGKAFDYRLNDGAWMNAPYGNAVLYVIAGTRLELRMPLSAAGARVTATIGGASSTWNVAVAGPSAETSCAGGTRRVWLQEGAVCIGTIAGADHADGALVEVQDPRAPGTGTAWFRCSDGQWTEPTIPPAPSSCTP